LKRRLAMGRAQLIAGVLAAVVVTAGLGFASRIAPLLPGEGGSLCYTGRFAGDQVLTFGWPHEHRTDRTRVTGMTPRLDLPAGQTPHRDTTIGYRFDWRYEFTILAETADRGRFRAGGQCDWTQDAFSAVTWDLYCFIDCDGGGIGVSRVPGQRALSVSWDADGWLRMASCGDGGEILRGGDTTKSFTLAAADAATCAKDLPAE
jgi:hypothetical protein